jgi:predicted  nucleic acid-binding Zn-ribbon protein
VIRENLRNLRQLQDVELSIRDLHNEIENIPKQIERIDQEVEDTKERLEEEKKTRDISQKKRRQLEATLEDLQSKDKKYKEQLLQVKTNKEYQAMLREIEVIEKEISDVETQIIVELENQDEIDEKIKEVEKEYYKRQEWSKKEKEKLHIELQELKDEHEKLSKHKKYYAEQLPQDLLNEYNRIKNVRNGLALAEVKDCICQVCFVRLPPQLYNDIKANKKLFTCSNCNRILYFKDDENNPS